MVSFIFTSAILLATTLSTIAAPSPQFDINAFLNGLGVNGAVNGNTGATGNTAANANINLANSILAQLFGGSVTGGVTTNGTTTNGTVTTNGTTTNGTATNGTTTNGTTTDNSTTSSGFSRQGLRGSLRGGGFKRHNDDGVVHVTLHADDGTSVVLPLHI